MEEKHIDLSPGDLRWLSNLALRTDTDTLSAPQQRAGLLIAWKLMAESYFSVCACSDPPVTPSSLLSGCRIC